MHKIANWLLHWLESQNVDAQPVSETAVTALSRVPSGAEVLHVKPPAAKSHHAIKRGRGRPSGAGVNPRKSQEHAIDFLRTLLLNESDTDDEQSRRADEQPAAKQAKRKTQANGGDAQKKKAKHGFDDKQREQPAVERAGFAESLLASNSEPSDEYLSNLVISSGAESSNEHQ